ncbi:thiol:disulfide interchange protein DsbA/DsbL [Variovorax sp. J31P207]|uniref:thiol:disulfide interchange protein DsbA/DsbL n=1 Tax=Variovorax sp. J31P207 TaxID=3053510 RepID=UPI002574AE01|nr:thiol:disulfide interchange protein DsbA/DsbL [Variovorax sp. J31P207]MDM0065847.1 thiol:disulfide interchange protein DsbA/DsbL [Variovorax sp. J31P207]
MQRRDFSLAAASLALLPLASPSHAQGRAFKAGTDYIVLGKPAPVDAPAGKVEVIEFFSFNCPHCAAFEPKVEPWIKQLPPHVAFRRVPVPFVGNDTDAKARFYYALEAMGKADEFVPKVFEAIHQQRLNLTGDAAILAWVEKQPGLDSKKFAELFKSFSVVGKAKRAAQLTTDYQVAGVPALGVAGRWYVDGDTAGSLDRALQTVDFLVTEARKG